MLLGVQRQLVDAGIDPGMIPEDWLIAIVAGTRKWVAESRDGACDAINLLGFEAFSGDPTCDYKLFDTLGGPDKSIKSENVTFFRGVMANGKAIHPTTLIISKRESNECAECGIVSHCTQELRHPRTDRLHSYCNHCLLLHDDTWFRSYAGSDTCSCCTKTTCGHHPSREPGRLIALRA